MTSYKHFVTVMRDCGVGPVNRRIADICSHVNSDESEACPFNRNEVQRAFVEDGEHICDFCGKRYGSEQITRKEAADIAKATGGDPEVWNRLFGVTA